MGHDLGGSFALGPWRVHRAGYGAMQLAGDGVFGPPRDRDEALRVLRALAIVSNDTPVPAPGPYGREALPGGGDREQASRGPSCAKESRTTSPPSASAGWRR